MKDCAATRQIMFALVLGTAVVNCADVQGRSHIVGAHPQNAANGIALTLNVSPADPQASPTSTP
jgi:hypothetical protein